MHSRAEQQPVTRWDSRVTQGIAFGGDYNPEQWPESVWSEDIALMKDAGVNLVSVGIFSWVLLEPHPGVFEPAWLDRLLDQLHAADIAVDLGTPTAAPPAWLYRNCPEAWVVDRDGRRLGPGSRGAMSPSSPEYRGAASRITRFLAQRYGSHPAVVMWHVHNEYGVPVRDCHSESSVTAFRSWLMARYGSLNGINEAWGSAFWGQRYGALDEIQTPAASASIINPSQQLDFSRFSDNALLECFVMERDIIKEYAPTVPVTTNFMASNTRGIDYWKWSREVDVVSNDHYLTAARPDAHILLALDADLTRSLAGSKPWILMEHSTSAVNWQPRNIAKLPGEMARNSLTHLARGADAILFFQWRASKKGAEKFHSAMLPHGGTNTRGWREVVELGATIAQLAEVAGAEVRAEVAILWDWESFWAQDLEWRPSADLSSIERIEEFYTSLWKDKVTVDFAHPGADLTGYKFVVAPQLYLVSVETAENLRSFVLAGGILFVSYFSGIVDQTDSIHPEGLAGRLGDVLGITIDEFAPLRENEIVQVNFDPQIGMTSAPADVWTEHLRVVSEDTEVLANFDSGPAAGEPALTRRRLGAGEAWYLATRISGQELRTILRHVLDLAGVFPITDLPDDVDIVRRHGTENDYLFVINNSDVDIECDLPTGGTEMLFRSSALGRTQVPSGQVQVLRQRLNER